MSKDDKVIRYQCSYCGAWFRGRKYWAAFARAVCKCGAILECLQGGKSPDFLHYKPERLGRTDNG